MSKKASYLFLKTPMLIGIGLIVAAIVSFGSSIAITHEGTAQFDFVVTDTLDNKTWQWDITEEEANKSRKLIIASPFQSAKVLNAAGYQPYHFNLTPIAGNRFSTDVFEAKAGLLLRLHPMQFNSAARIKLTVTLPNGTIKTIDSINNFSVLIGSKSQFTANQKENWKSELIRMEAIPEFLHDVAIEKWQDPNMEIGNYEFKPGDKVKLTKISGRDTSIQEIIIENKKLNDVLLQ